jgi:hypothetical protein
MMGFGMSFGFSQRIEHRQVHRQVQRQEQRLEQTLAQRLKQKQSMSAEALLSIRVQILEALHPGGVLEPEAKCPNCGHQLKTIEILSGFLADPNDTTTGCPKCKTRFQPRLKRSNQAGSYELPFYCEIQTVEKMRELGPLPFTVYEKDHPAILASARFYWGGLRTGFLKLDIEYDQDPPNSWKDKILSFLGKAPDALIAEVCNVSATSVGRLRREKKIKVYRKRKRRKCAQR